jgi:Carboxypeptidase regulatory-like domain
MTGTVINQATSAPIAGAVVQIGDTTVTTGADGRYELGDLTLGLATLRCSAASYAVFEEVITVIPGIVFRDIALTRTEAFQGVGNGDL